MEQWVLDGRDIIRDRGFSRVPTFAEEDGYTFDASGGLRGMLKKMKRPASTSTSTVHADPEADGVAAAEPSDTANSVIINYAKGLPQLYAECEVDYVYRFNGRIVDSNKEAEAAADLAAQIEREGAEAAKMRRWQEDLDRQTAAAIAAASSATTEGGSAAQQQQQQQPTASEPHAPFPTPAAVPKASPYYPLDLVVGAGQVTQAMDEALLSMYEGEETEWWLDPAFAFRDHGLRTKFGSIPADAAIQMTVRLIRFNNPMSSFERIGHATKLKDEANAILQKALARSAVEAEAEEAAKMKGAGGSASAVESEGPAAEEKAGDAAETTAAALFQAAVLAYNNALTKMGNTFVFKKKAPPLDEEQQRLQRARRGDAEAEAEAEEGAAVKLSTAVAAATSQSAVAEPPREAQIALDAHLRAVLLTNLSLCWFRRGDLARSTDYCDRALRHRPNYGKAVYRKALIEERRCNFDEAVALLEGLLRLAAAGEGSAEEAGGLVPSAAAGINVVDVEAKIAALKATSAQQDEAQRRTFGGMFRAK